MDRADGASSNPRLRSDERRRARRRVWGWAAVLLLGCHKLVGDYSVESSAATCTPRATQCVGNVLQRCNGEGSAWENAAVCASEALCDAAGAACMQAACEAGARRCAGVELQGCNAVRDGWSLLATCPTAGHCSATTRTCTEQPCEAGKTQCNGGVLQVCKDDRSGWNDLRDCGSAALCSAERGECTDRTCGPGEFACNGAVLQTCNAALDGWTAVQSCDSAALCNAATGTCAEVGCTTPGAFRCDEAGALERCADDLTGWTAVAACESVAHCDALNGTCTEVPCKPGDYQCNGSTLQVCNADSTGWDSLETCQTDGLCQQTLAMGESQCREPACAAGTFRCEGEQPQVCNAARTAFRDNGTPCLTAELCNGASGTCGVPVCNPGQTRCTGAQPETCNPGRTTFIAQGPPCASTTLCRPETGTCGDAVCAMGQKRCHPTDPTLLQVCNSTLDDWDECDTCATSELCSASLGAVVCGAGACVPPTCSLGDRWCGGAGNRSLYTCPSSRINTQAAALDECETEGLCELTRADAARTICYEKSCNLEDRWCGGPGNASLYKCPPSLINSEAAAVDVCETAGLCAQAHADPGALVCPEPACDTPGFSCGGTGSRVLRYCNPERTSLATCDTCDSAALCTASLNATTCDANACRVCTPGAKACDGSQLRICNAGGTGFDTVSCGSAALCMSSLVPASQSVCDACVEGTFNCAGAQPQQCDDPGNAPAIWEDRGLPCEDAAACDADTGTCESDGAGGAGGGGG